MHLVLFMENQILKKIVKELWLIQWPFLTNSIHIRKKTKTLGFKINFNLCKWKNIVISYQQTCHYKAWFIYTPKCFLVICAWLYLRICICARLYLLSIICQVCVNFEISWKRTNRPYVAHCCKNLLSSGDCWPLHRHRHNAQAPGTGTGTVSQCHRVTQARHRHRHNVTVSQAQEL